METQNSTLLLLNKVRILTGGVGIAILNGNSNAIETWVNLIAKKASAHVDWCFRGGKANIFHLGNKLSRERVLRIIYELANEFEGEILSIGGVNFCEKHEIVLPQTNGEFCIFAVAQ